MKTKKRLIPALVLSLFAAASAPANAVTFSNVYVFGDSLSDAGYYRPFLTSLGLPASLVATLGRFTINPGPVWSELVATHYGVSNPRPSNAGGTIYAQGGARVALPSVNTPPGGAQRPVSTQINEFLAAGGGTADPNALYAVWGGGNDILQNVGAFSAGAITQAQLQANVLAAATAEVGEVARLRAAGARYILVFGLPDIGATPSAAAGGAAGIAAATALSAGFNTTLFTGLASAGIRAIPVDTFGLFNDVRANAAAFGFTNTTGQACLPFPPITTTPSSQFCTAANIQPGGQTYLFADSVHPTPASQAILADYVQSLIDGPSQYSYLAETALRTRAAHVRTIANGAATASTAEVGRFTAFAAADGADFDVDPQQGNLGQTTSNTALTLGVSARVSENVTLGAAFGTNSAKAVTGNGGGAGSGGYRIKEHAYSLFAIARGENLYGQAAVTMGEPDFTNIRRDVKLGPVTRTMDAGTKGANASFFGSAGYDFRFGRLAIGPLVGVAYQNVEVDGFEETPIAGAPITGALSIGSQKRRSEVFSVGGRASYDFGMWTPWIRVTADKERRDDARFVSAGVRSLGAVGITYDIEGFRPDTSFVTTHVGIRGRFSEWIAAGLTYYNVSSRSGIKEDGITGSLSFRF